MKLDPTRDYDELVTPAAWPESARFHQLSKLTERRGLELEERASAFARAAEERWPVAQKTYPSRPQLALPRAKRSWLSASLQHVLATRRSQRGAFRPGMLDRRRLGTLLERAFGITAVGTEAAPALRAWPSAGGLYPLEIYVATLRCEEIQRRLHHYDAHSHTLAELGECPDDLRPFLFADHQHAALAVFVTAVFERTQSKYDERGYRFALLEAGHAMQNALLVAHSLGMGGLPLGGFCEDAIGRWLELDPKLESPVYAALFGA